jgi:hypothetical protein
VRALTSLGARVQALPPGRADLLLAGAFLLETQVELSFLDASAGTVLAARGLTFVMACGVAARRRAPLLAAALVFAALTVMERLHGPVNTSLVGPYVSAFIVSYSVGANLEGRRLAMLAGRLLRDRARLARSLRVAAGEDDGRPWAAQAASEEHSRIAADLHYVVARGRGRRTRGLPWPRSGIASRGRCMTSWGTS